jgi:hypothetical protein
MDDTRDNRPEALAGVSLACRWRVVVCRGVYNVDRFVFYSRYSARCYSMVTNRRRMSHRENTYLDIPFALATPDVLLCLNMRIRGGHALNQFVILFQWPASR